MSFNSLLFLTVFLPVTLIIYWCLIKYKSSKEANVFLAVASLVFYASSAQEGTLVLLFTLIVNYLLAKYINKPVFIGGVLFNILVLAFFKYVPVIFPSFSIPLKTPGISFYIFAETAFLVEVYKGRSGRLSVGEYTFLITYFPKLLQGPITLPKDMVPYFDAPKKIDAELIYRSIMLFTLGMFKKVIIADTLGGAVAYGYDSLPAMHTGESLALILSYTLQLYFDFSGYCDMAMAISSLFGFKLPINFDSPYKAKNIEDFWKRWHITLTRFFTEYIYIPLGGNRKGAARTYLNIFIVFFISGLWHGAGLTFIIWGLMHGVLYIITRALKKSTSLKDREENKFLHAFKVLCTFAYVNIAWVFFRAPSVKAAVDVFKGVGEFWLPRFNKGLAECFNLNELWYVLKVLKIDSVWWGVYVLMFLILAFLLILVFFGNNAYEFSSKCKINLVNTLFMTVLFIWCFISLEGVSTYLYVNF